MCLICQSQESHITTQVETAPIVWTDQVPVTAVGDFAAVILAASSDVASYGVSTQAVRQETLSEASSPTSELDDQISHVLGLLAGLGAGGQYSESQVGASSAAEDPFAGSTNTLLKSTNDYIEGLLYGAGNSVVRWDPTQTVTYDFPDLFSDYGAYAWSTSGFQQVSFDVRTAVRSILGNATAALGVNGFTFGSVASFTNLNLVDQNGFNAADISVGRTNLFDGTDLTTARVADFPRIDNRSDGGDVWFGDNYAVYNAPKLGDYGWITTIHELGHSLGLKHAHNLGGGTVAVPADRDAMEFTVMSYRSYINGPTTGYTNETYGYAQTFMMLDIQALQFMYGADFTTNSSNTTYTFSETTGEMFVNGVGQGEPGGNRVFLTIWDGNGVDTYNFSNYSGGMTVDLAPGGWSLFSTTQQAYLGGGNQYARANVYNALQYNGDARSLIENAIGGSGGDTLYGNNANNLLDGNGGADVLYGLNGNDTLFGRAGADSLFGGANDDNVNGGAGADYLDGGSGTDTAYFEGQVLVDLSNMAGNIGDSVGDTFVSIEIFAGSQYVDAFFGDAGANTFYGNGGNDVLNGRGGNDFLYGGDGDDSLEGGTGADAISGGNGFDFTAYEYSVSGVTVDLLNVGANTGDAAGDGFYSIEGIKGSAQADNLRGDNGNNTLYGNGGDDYLFGRSGSDTLAGGDGNDSILGEDGADFLFGGNGYDYLFGGTGADSLYGEGGYDFASYQYSAGGLIADLQFAAAQNTGEAAGDSYYGIEGLIGSGGADELRGDANGNYIYGGSGGDAIYGRDGDDTLIGQDGNDTLWGGNNNDTFEFSAGFGLDTIGDFVAGNGAGDVMRILLGAAYDSYAEIMSVAQQVGSNTVITLDASNSITLLNVSRNGLAVDDFRFA